MVTKQYGIFSVTNWVLVLALLHSGHSRPTTPPDTGYYSGSPTPPTQSPTPTPSMKTFVVSYPNCTDPQGCAQLRGMLALVVPVEQSSVKGIHCKPEDALCHIRFGREISDLSVPNTKEPQTKCPDPDDLLCHIRYGDAKNEELGSEDEDHGKTSSGEGQVSCPPSNPLCHFNPGGKRFVEQEKRQKNPCPNGSICEIAGKRKVEEEKRQKAPCPPSQICEIAGKRKLQIRLGLENP